MPHLAVAIYVDAVADVPLAIERAASAVREGATLIEWRIDAIADEPDAPRLVARLLEASAVPCIITCRPTWEGGGFDGDDDDRVSLFEAIGTGDHAPRYLDVELAAYTRSANLRQKINLVVDHAKQPRDLKTSLILSTHDFGGRPPDLLRRIAAMAGEPACSVIKVAWMARSLRDNLEIFELLRTRPKPMIALCMGEFGLPSRVLAGKFGGLLTFAAPETGGGTAPGQPTVRELRERWRFDRIGPATRVYGVIGWPVEQSKSPLLHNAAFDACGHDGVYLPMPIAPEWEPFKATLGAWLDEPTLHFRGASVTLPHKSHLLAFVRGREGVVDAGAAAIGAANTLVVEESGALRCFNADAPAALATLIEEGGIAEASLREMHVALLGAGGAARAIAWALADAGAQVVLFNRNEERAEKLAHEFNGKATRAGRPAKVIRGRLDQIACGCFPVVVNATSVGMRHGPAPDESPLPDDFPFEGTTIFDTVYAPALTPLLRDARERGAKTIGGLGMFLRQAALQSEAWTRKPAPIERWRTLLRSVSLAE